MPFSVNQLRDKQYRVWKKWFAKHEDLELVLSTPQNLFLLSSYVQNK